MSNLSAYRASAGSGKTFTLTREYLNLLFQDDKSYKNILAVTFTNKASGEMKNRIISELYNLSSNKPSKYLDIICLEHKLNAHEVQQKAATILEQILHNYSFFFVETIDKFFQRVIKNFAKELGIYSLQTVELDNQRILDLAIRQMFIDIDNNPDLKIWLQSFISHQIENGESYNVKKKILEFGKELFSESISFAISNNQAFYENTEAILQIYKTFDDFIKETDSQMSQIAQSALNIMANAGISVEDCYYGNKGAAQYFVKIMDGDYTPSKRVEDVIENPEKLALGKTSKKQEILQAINAGLVHKMQEAAQLWEQTRETYYTGIAMLRFRFTFPVITKLHGIILDYCRTNNIHLLSNNNLLLRSIIKNNPTPFVYEKMGTFLQNFMIDEFQDTSNLQWENMKPLVDNSLAADKKSLVVGDVKQSIYRWRNGDWRLLGHNIYNDFENRVETHLLQTNYRSDGNIISFNNRLFDSCKELLTNQLQNEIPDNISLPDSLQNVIQKVYDDVYQKTANHKEDKGFVSVEFLGTRQEFTDSITEKLPKTIEKLQDNGFKPSEIAIIVRRNEECRQVVNMLLDYKKTNAAKTNYCYDVISSEALELGTSSAINIIIHFLNVYQNPKDTLAQSFIVHEFNKQFSKEPPISQPKTYQALIERYNINLQTSLSLFEKSEHIITQLSLATPSEIPYLKDFQDTVLQFTTKQDSSISAFLSWWNEKGKTTSVKLPEGQNAIQVLSIHKSKGLEFKAVILPFCNWSLSTTGRTILWCNLKQNDYFPIHPVLFDKNMKESSFKTEYYTELVQQYIDNINLLYVALTRAENAMYIFCENKKNITDIKTVSDLFYYFNNKTSTHYDSGALSHNDDTQKSKTEIIDCQYPTYGLSDAIVFATHGKSFFEDFEATGNRARWGTILHEILSSIETTSQTNMAIEQAFRKGLIDKQELEKISTLLTNALSLTQTKEWFDGSMTVLSETAIVSKTKGTKRPDRIMLNGNRAIVVDYKFTSTKSSKHKEQIAEYTALLQEMGFNTEAYLWYVQENSIEKIDA